MMKKHKGDPEQSGEPLPPEGPKFELTGGDICLDFANTVDNRAAEIPRELLNSYEDLLQWSLQKGVIPSETGDTLRGVAAGHPRRASSTLRRARALREAIFEVFHASAQGESPPADALATLNKHLPTAFRHLCLYTDESGYHWECEDDDTLDRMFWPVVRSAANLLTSERLSRVRICSAETCDWLFLDQSKNRSRRWCDMNVCGNRSKARRYRETHRTS